MQLPARSELMFRAQRRIKTLMNPIKPASAMLHYIEVARRLLALVPTGMPRCFSPTADRSGISWADNGNSRTLKRLVVLIIIGRYRLH